MCLTTLPIGLTWLAFRPSPLSPRAIVGCVMVGAAFMLYAVAVSYTDFIRAVLLFYLAPAWSTLIEVAFFKRRWTSQSAVAILFSLIGVLLISRGEISFGLCRECGGNSRSAPPGRVGMTQLRRLRQERRVRRADRGFPIRRPSASGSGRMRAAPTEAWARFPVSAGPSGS